MAANYQEFTVYRETELGAVEHVGAGTNVAVRLEGAGADAAESPLTTNADGRIVAGSIAAAVAGDIAHFRVENANGVAQSVAQTLT